MSKAIPLIQSYMTRALYSISEEQTLSAAHDFMKQRDIRHLPVMFEGQLVGLLSERDLRVAMSFRGMNPATCQVKEISKDEAFLVRPDARLDGVAEMMAEKKIGSVLVVDHHRLVGIFTTSDAMRALGDLLRDGLKARPGEQNG